MTTKHRHGASVYKENLTHLDTLGTRNIWEGCELVWSKVNLVRYTQGNGQGYFCTSY